MGDITKLDIEDSNNLYKSKGTPFLKIVLLCLLITLFLATGLIAAPPASQVHSGTTGYEIEFPAVIYVKENTDLKLHFHLFNESNGVPILNQSTECNFHLYNSTGSHIYKEGNISAMSSVFDFEVEINGENFSKLGDYNYIFQCNSSLTHQGGYVEHSLMINKDGKEPTTPTTGGTIAITLFILVIMLSLFGVALFKDELSENPFVNIIAKRGLMVVGLYLMVLNSGIMATIALASGLDLANEMFRYMWLFGIAGWTLMLYTLFKTLLDVLKMYQTIQKDKRMGEFK